MVRAPEFWKCPRCGGYHTRIKRYEYDWDRYCDNCKKGFTEDRVIRYAGMEDIEIASTFN